MYINRRSRIISGVLIVILFAVSPVSFAKEVIGWVEKVTIHPGGLVLKAKIDSGAKTSSIHCDCEEFIERDGDKYVKLVVTNFNGNQIHIERKIERFATIKRHFGETQERAVINLGVCVADTYKEVEVNVIDRSGLKYQILIGRNFLAGDFLIDVDKTYATEPGCENNRK